MNTSATLAGTQVVGRVTRILRTVSSSMPGGIGTSEIARRVAIARPTVHRLLSSLAEQGFTDRDQRTGNWLLGPEIYIMGHVAAERYDITEAAREHVSKLAELTGESAFLSVRRGDETVCLLREDGSFPIRSFVLYEGKRFPLGVASAGIAILSFLPESAVDAFLERNDLEKEFGDAHSSDEIRMRVVETRRNGFSTNPGLIVNGSWGLGAAVFDQSGQPAWALSLTGIEPRFTAERRKELGKLLLRHAHLLSKHLQGT